MEAYSKTKIKPLYDFTTSKVQHSLLIKNGRDFSKNYRLKLVCDKEYINFIEWGILRKHGDLWPHGLVYECPNLYPHYRQTLGYFY